MVILLLPVPHFCYSMSICLALLGRSGHAVAEAPGQGYSKPPFSIQLSWTGIVDIGQKLRTNSDPSVTEISLQIAVRLTDWGAFWEKKKQKTKQKQKIFLYGRLMACRGCHISQKQTATRVSQKSRLEMLIWEKQKTCRDGIACRGGHNEQIFRMAAVQAWSREAGCRHGQASVDRSEVYREKQKWLANASLVNPFRDFKCHSIYVRWPPNASRTMFCRCFTALSTRKIFLTHLHRQKSIFGSQEKISENGVECVENAKKVCQCCEKRSAIVGHEKSWICTFGANVEIEWKWRENTCW